MRKVIFAAGIIIGFIAGTRAGRERYDQLVGLGRKVVTHPKVQSTTQAASARAQGFTKTAAARAPGLAKSATAQVSAQVPKITSAASAARQQAVSRMPFIGGRGGSAGAPPEEAVDTADAQVPYQPGASAAEGSATAPYNGVPSTTD